MSLAYSQTNFDLGQVCLYKFKFLACHLDDRVDPSYDAKKFIQDAWNQQAVKFQSLIAMIGADKQPMDATSLDYRFRLHNTPHTNVMFKTHFGVIAEVLDSTIWTLSEGLAASHESDLPSFIPEGKLREQLNFSHRQLRGPTVNLCMLWQNVFPDPQHLCALEYVLYKMAFRNMPGPVASSFPLTTARPEGQVEVKPWDKSDLAGRKPLPTIAPQTMFQGRTTAPLHCYQNTGNGPLLSPMQPIPQRTSTDTSLPEKPVVDRIAPRQGVKRRASGKPPQFHRRPKTDIRIAKAPSDATVANVECEKAT